jgi:hypothetical protein
MIVALIMVNRDKYLIEAVGLREVASDLNRGALFQFFITENKEEIYVNKNNILSIEVMSDRLPVKPKNEFWSCLNGV